MAAHQAWYAGHDNSTATSIVRVLAPRGSAKPLSETQAVTITRYADKAPPANDAARAAFVADYEASSKIKSEIRVCMPAGR